MTPHFLQELRRKFFDDCTGTAPGAQPLKQVNMAPHDIFEWFVKELEAMLGNTQEIALEEFKDDAIHKEAEALIVAGFPDDFQSNSDRNNGFIWGYRAGVMRNALQQTVTLEYLKATLEPLVWTTERNGFWTGTDFGPYYIHQHAENEFWLFRHRREQRKKTIHKTEDLAKEAAFNHYCAKVLELFKTETR